MDSKNFIHIKRALISVSDKKNIIPLAKKLKELNVEIIATSGTLKILKDNNIEAINIENFTGNPQSFNGRMKTISFKLESSILYNRDCPDDVNEAKSLGIPSIDLVICNLYPFSKIVEEQGNDNQLIDNIDIGGPTMIRSAAKNFNFVSVLTSPDQYQDIINVLDQNNGMIDLESRKKLAASAFDLTTRYDSLITREFSKRFLGKEKNHLFLEKKNSLRYGENSHQSANLYTYLKKNNSSNFLATAPVIQGKELSYNNLIDADSAYCCSSNLLELDNNNHQGVVVVKHCNPCGIALGKNQLQCLKDAFESDPVSAFGGIVSFTHELSVESANWLNDKFIEVLIAPSISDEAKFYLQKKKNLRVILCPPKESIEEERLISISGGILIQNDDIGIDPELQVVTKEPFPIDKIKLAKFGIVATKFLKSNAISIVHQKNENFQLLGAGMGQPNRVESLLKLAIPRAKDKSNINIEESIMVSDAFFPFRDCVDIAQKEGIKYIVSPGGSIRDKEVIDACNEFNISMIFTGRRHFRH